MTNQMFDDLPDPSKEAINIANIVFSCLLEEGIYYFRISHSAEGGMMFEHTNKKGYHMIEIYNDGSIAYLRHNHNEEIYDKEFSVKEISDLIKKEMK